MTMIPTIEITPLMLACQNNDVESVRLIISKGVEINAVDANNRIALFYCVENTETECVDELIKNQANINHQDKDGYSCLHLSVICGNFKIVEYLVQHGADVNMTDAEMHSAVHWSVVCGQESILDFLLNNNADPETADIHGAYPIHYAAQMCGQIDIWDESLNRDQTKSLSILKKLINQRVKIDVEDFDQRNAIIWAASSGSSEALLELFAAGSDPNKHEKDGLTALHCASSRNHVECIGALIENCKTSVDIMDNNNCTPIFYAATLGQLEACNALIKYGANLHVQDCKGRTVYHCAAAKGQLKCLKSLCKKNSNIWLRNRRGDYPIHEAYYNKQIECLYFLLDVISDKRASKSSNMYDGRTILHLAAADNDLKLCKRLVTDGIDVNCLMRTSSTTYMTPYDVAVIKNSKECAKYLKSIGGLNGSEIAEKLTLKMLNYKMKNYKNVDQPDGDEVNPIKVKTNAVVKTTTTTTTTEKTKKDKKSVEKKKLDEKQVIKESTQVSVKTKKGHPHNANVNGIKLDPDMVKKLSDDSNNIDSSNEWADSKKSFNHFVNQHKNDSLDDESDEGALKNELEVSNYELDKIEPTTNNTRDKSNRKTSDNDKRNKEKRANELAMRNEKTLEKLSHLENLYGQQKTGQKTKPSLSKKKSKTKADADDDLRHKEISFASEKDENKAQQSSDWEDFKKEDKTYKFLNEKSMSKIKKTSHQKKNKNDKKTIQITDVKYSKYNDGEYEIENNEELTEIEIKPKKGSNPKTLDTDENDYDNSDYNQHSRKPSTDFNRKKHTNNDLLTGTSKKRDELSYRSRREKSRNLFDSYNNANLNRSEDNIVKLIIRPEAVSNSAWTKRKYATLFDKQRLILKSLYEIRRCRINNRDIVINSDLNNLLVKHYNFDIKKNCKSLKDLERMLEVIAIEISDEYRKHYKRSHTLVSIKPKNLNLSTWKSSDNILRSEERKKLQDENKKSNLNESTSNDFLKLKQEKVQNQSDQLKIAYKSLLPNDIYKQYYNTNTRYANPRDQTVQKEKTILLPVISQKPSFSI